MGLVAIGLNQLVADLGRASLTATLTAGKVLDEVSEKIEDTAKLLVPVREGTTRDSIGTDRLSLLAREIGPTTHYARFLEDGTAHMAPHAFMGPALDRHSHELEILLAEAIDL